MDSQIQERFLKPIVSPLNPVRDDLALLGHIRLAAGPVDPFHSLHYWEFTGLSPNEQPDLLDLARHGNTIARWWAHQRMHLTDADDDDDDSGSEISRDDLSHSLESTAGWVSPALSVTCFTLKSDPYLSPLKSCLKGSRIPLPSDSTSSLTETPICSPTAKLSGRRVMFNEIVLESMIAETPVTVINPPQELALATDTQDDMGLGDDDWVHVPAHSTLGLELGPEKNNIQPSSPSPSLIPHTTRTPQLTIKAVIPLYPVALFPPPRSEEVGVTVKFVPPTGMTSLTVEDLLPSDRALRAAADAELVEAIDRLYARHDHGFMVETVFAGGYRDDGGGEGGGYGVEGWECIGKEGRMRGRERVPKVLLGSLAGVEPRGSAPPPGSRAGSIGRPVSVCVPASGVVEVTPLKDGGDGVIEHKAKASRGMFAKVAGLAKGWMWRSG